MRSFSFAHVVMCFLFDKGWHVKEPSRDPTRGNSEVLEGRWVPQGGGGHQ